MSSLAVARSATALIGLFLCLSTIGCRESAATYLERGNRALAEGNLKEADIAFRRAAQAGANKAEILYRRGIVRLEQKKVFEAYTYLSQAAAGLPGVIYREGSAQGAGATVTFSVDGGKTYDVPAKLFVFDGSGRRYAARPRDYTHIRWTFKAPLLPGAKGDVSFRAVLQ